MAGTDVVRRVGLPAIGIAVGNLALLGVLIGYDGASRAYSVALATLFRDHLAAVIATLVAAGMLAAALGWTLPAMRELWVVVGFAVATDLIAATLVTVLIDEMHTFPDLPKAFLIETAGGLQILSITLGCAAGCVARRRRPG